MLESHTGRLTLKLKAIQDPPLGKAGQVVWFLINPPAKTHTHQPRQVWGLVMLSIALKKCCNADYA